MLKWRGVDAMSRMLYSPSVVLGSYGDLGKKKKKIGVNNEYF